MSRKPDSPCADCGKLMYRGSSSLPVGQARCQPCRRERPPQPKATTIPHICVQCGVTFYCASRRTRHCSRSCLSQAMQIRPPDDTRVKRTQREQAAPGLSKARRYQLRDQLIRRGTQCAYCDNQADTIDHVVPLVRGGTNYEGNLVVCCKSCNSSKSGSTIMEWRTGRRLPRMTAAIVWPERPKRQPKLVKIPVVRNCPLCGTPTTRPTYCSNDCQLETAARRMRDKYRASVGLPIDPTRATNPWKRDVSLKLG